MVEPEADLLIESEESQTVFEGHQNLMQPPPVETDEPKRKKKIYLALFATILLIGMVVLARILSGSNDQIALIKKNEPTPSPTPIFIDQAKEDELKRVEEIVKNANPEDLLIAPPQVDMTVAF